MGWTKIGCKLGAAILWQCCCCCLEKKNDEIHGSCLHILQSHEQDDCSKLEGTVNLNGTGTVCAKSNKKGFCLWQWPWKWNMVLTYIGPLNRKHFGIKHTLQQPGHIVSAASSSRLVGQTLLTSYITVTGTYSKLIAHIDASISKIQPPPVIRLCPWNTGRIGVI